MSVAFTRFTETIHCKEDKRVVSVTVKLLLEDCTGTVYFTDIQAQEGNRLLVIQLIQKHASKIPGGRTIVPARFITEWFVAERRLFSSIWVQLPQVLTVISILYRIWLQAVSNCLKGQGRIG